jgi:hypothetical protein
MSNHRDSSDAVFDAHLATLDETSLDNKIAAWAALKVLLDAEKNAVATQRGQIVKHKKKVNDMLDDLDSLKNYSGVHSNTFSNIVVATATQNDETFNIARDCDFFILKHNNLSGLNVYLPTNPISNKIYTCKNCNTNLNNNNNPIFCGVDPTQAINNAAYVGPQKTLDLQYDKVQLNSSSSTGTELDTSQKQCFRAVYYAAENSFISISDAV